MSNLTERQLQILRDMAERGGVIYYTHFVEVHGQTRMQFPDTPVENEDLRAIFGAGLVETDEDQSNVTGERFRINDAGREKVSQ